MISYACKLISRFDVYLLRTKASLSVVPSARVGYGIDQGEHYMTSECNSVSRTTLTERRILIR
ncbi:hypothetical protein ANCCAN_21634 [Ancylostoma caninum]|uniref:Uncharacterized protein n=1 Tax=Ancylostoma caninum TaxID=29170 RepID=A0A368FK80_ANCCA|nr:hypothetical protein ANCCAN_21634 [Ancylostoma caninum]